MGNFVYEPSLKIKELIKSDSAKKNFRIVFENPELNDYINKDLIQSSFSLNESVSSGDFHFGGSESSSVEFKVFNLPNVKDELFAVYVEYYCEENDDSHSEYKEDIDSYVFPIYLGTFIVKECKKEAANVNIRKITGITFRQMLPVLANEINNVRAKGRFPVDINGFLFANDNQDVDWTTFLIRENDLYDVTNSVDYRFEYNSVIYRLEVKFRVNRNTFSNAFLEYDVNFLKDLQGIYNGIDALYPSDIPSGLKNAAYSFVKNLLEYMQRRVLVGKPLYIIDEEFTRGHFPPHGIFLSVTGNNGYNQSGYIAFDDVSFDRRYNFDSEFDTMNIILPVPAIGEENDFIERVRKDWYELNGVMALARRRFAPKYLMGTDSLFPSNDLYPNDDVFPSGSVDAYTTDLIKNLWMDDVFVKYKAIQFKWKCHDVDNTFTWKMPTDIENLDILDPIFYQPNQLYKDGILYKYYPDKPFQSNYGFMVIGAAAIQDIYVDMYSNGEKIGNIAIFSNSGMSDLSDKLNVCQFSEGYVGDSCKFFHDRLPDVDEIRIGQLNGEPFDRDLDILILEFKNIYHGIEEVEYLEDDLIYEISDNIILDECLLDATKIPYFIYQLDREIRKINYIPIDMEAKGLPNNEVGSQVEIQLNDMVFNTLILNRTLKGDASLQDSFDS